jgi:predicted transcriptional regulator
MTSSIGEIEFLARSEHRVGALRTLRDGPSDRDDLREATDASNATIARLLNEFEDRNWIVRDGHEYELTDPGTFVADEFLRLVDRMGTELELRDVWQWFPTELPGCRMSLFADAVISKPDFGSPYRPLPRFRELTESVRIVRGFQGSYSKPESYQVFQRILDTGGEMRIVNSLSQIDMKLREISEDVIREAVESGRLTLWAHESLPTNAGVAFFDERLCVICRDDEQVTRVIVDTDASEAVVWGESVIEDVRSEARPVDLLERLERNA